MKILCLEDSAPDAEIIRELLNDEGFCARVDWVKAAHEFGEALRGSEYDIILSDFGLPGFDAFAALRMTHEIRPDVPFICVSGSIGEETAIELIRQGAVDYILKDRLVRLPSAIRRALDEVEERDARRHTEEALRESENRFRLLFESSMDAVILASPTGEIFSANPATCKMFGRSEEELCAVGRDGLVELKDPHLIPALEKIAREGTFIGELTMLRKDGTPFPAEVSTSVFHDQSGRERSSIIIRDITERKRAEEILRRMEERIRKSEKMDAIGQLAGGIAHDFNNVLGGIIGYTGLSLEYAEKGSKLEKNLLRILTASDRAKHLVTQILTFSRQGSSQKLVISLQPIVREVLDLLTASIPSSVLIESEMHSDTKPVLADPTMIHEVLLNLANNAVHAMKRKGRLAVRHYAQHVTSVVSTQTGDILPGEYTVLEVADTGSGMDPATLAKAFEPFFTTKPVGEGTGMGLSVVLGIVQLHDGVIQVDSAEGVGTTVRIYLPVSTEAPAAVSEENAEAVLTGTERVVFVDDEQMQIDINVEWLTSLGYEVTALSNSLDALKFINEMSADIDLLITDQTMPNMTGMELAKEALKIRKDLPIIICTGYSSDVTSEQAALIGLRKFLMKPYRLYDISKAIREVLDDNKNV